MRLFEQPELSNLPEKNNLTYAHGIFMALFLFLSVSVYGGQTSWTGSVSTDWNTAGNWTAGVPDPNDTITINNVTNDPVIHAEVIAVGRRCIISGILTIEEGGTLTINGFSDLPLAVYGTVHNHGVINVGMSITTGNLGVWVQGTLNNGSTGVINLGKLESWSLFTVGAGTVNNDGLLNIQNPDTSFAGIYNNANFNNNAEGEVIIRKCQFGIDNQGTISNEGNILIENIGNTGISNSEILTNEATGIITINKINFVGIGVHDDATFDNYGQYIFGTLPSSGTYGMQIVGVATNHPGGTYTINNSQAAGIRLWGNPAGTLINKSIINIGSTHVENQGINVDGLLINELTGVFNFGSSSAESIRNDGGSIINYGVMNSTRPPSQSTGTSMVSFGMFENAACGIYKANTKLNFYAPAVNYGLMEMTHTNTNPNSPDSITNHGIITSTMGMPVPVEDNFDLYIPRIEVQCGNVTNALQIGAMNSFTVNTTWYFDVAQTQVAGTYNQATNTFTPTQISNDGTYTLYANITDNVNGCARIVKIGFIKDDTTGPVITCPGNSNVNVNSSCQYIIPSYASTPVSDNCAPANAITMTQSPVAGTMLSGAGTSQLVTLTANDGNGNSSTCAFTITLTDLTTPLLVCKNISITLSAGGSASIVPMDVYNAALSSDNCGTIQLVSVTPNTFSCSNVGDNVVTLTANDGHGNISTCQATVTVMGSGDAVANAGPDQTGAATCGLTQVTLAANTPPVGTGMWSIAAGAGGSFANASSPTSTFSGVAGNTYTLTWTVTTGPCSSAADQMTVTFNRNPTTANAGADQTGAATCGLTQVTLGGNAPSVGTGLWSKLSGIGGNFSNASSPTSTFNGNAGETYTLQWTISNAPCASSSDVMTVTFNQFPTEPNAGPDQTDAATCGLTQVALAANAPVVGTGAWSIAFGPGGIFDNASNPNTIFHGVAGQNYTLAWIISSDICGADVDVMDVKFNRNPTTANAGADQTGAGTCGLTQVTLGGNTPSVGTGLWSKLSGTGGNFSNAFSPTSTFNGNAGETYTLQWTISNAPCASSSDVMTVTFNQNPTAANAGPDQTGAATCDASQVNLAANTAAVGTGAWSIISGVGGSFTNASNPTTQFTGLAGENYTLAWTISTVHCGSSVDQMQVTFNLDPTIANAGPDQTGTATCGTTSANMAANTAVVGTGAWSVVSGIGGSFDNASNPTAIFSGNAGEAYTLAWTITTAICGATSDEVIVTFNEYPTTANAGADQTGSATCDLMEVTMAGNTPTAGTGTWTMVNSMDGNFDNAADPTTIFHGLSGDTYTLEWTIATAHCGSSSDQMTVTFNLEPTIANAGPDQTDAATCGNAEVTMNGNTVFVGAGEWSVVTGTGGSFDNTNNATALFSGNPGETYTLAWTISTTLCGSTSDQVTVTLNNEPTTADAGIDQTDAATCGQTSVALNANAPAIGTGTWSVSSGTGGSFDDASNPAATFSGVTGSSYTLTWTIANAPCTSSTDYVNVTFNQNPTLADAGADQTDADVFTILTANSPVSGSGLWTIISGDGGSFDDATDPTTAFYGAIGVTYTLQWTISNEPCASSSDQVTIAFDPHDIDGDGVTDAEDNCVDIANADQLDSDCDTVGDVCDVCPGGDDTMDNNGDGQPDCAVYPGYDFIPESWKCGNRPNQRKVLVCHGTHQMCVKESNLQNHLNHGDYLGPCGTANCEEIVERSVEVTIDEDDLGDIIPNPASDEILVRVDGDGIHPCMIRIVDMRGMVVNEMHVSEPTYQVPVDVSELAAGLYVVQLWQEGQPARAYKLVVERS
jgi:hypothetical protein